MIGCEVFKPELQKSASSPTVPEAGNSRVNQPPSVFNSHDRALALLGSRQPGHGHGEGLETRSHMSVCELQVARDTGSRRLERQCPKRATERDAA
jgi:hypothetical protein